MGHSYKRIGKNGRPRYTAVYLDARGKRRSAGTTSNRKAADRLWQDAELKSLRGGMGDPSRGRVLFRDYALTTWLSHHQLELTTRERYESSIRRHLLPTFGDRRMIEIWPQDVREWMTDLLNAGVSASAVASSKTILSAIVTTALNDQIEPPRSVRRPGLLAQPVGLSRFLAA